MSVNVNILAKMLSGQLEKIHQHRLTNQNGEHTTLRHFPFSGLDVQYLYFIADLQSIN